MPDVRCKILTTTAELESFVPAWRSLWQTDLHATPFQHPAWLVPWWRQFGEGGLRAVVLWCGTDVIGFLPLYIYRDPPSRQRHLLPLGVGTTDYLDGVFRPDCSAGDIRHGIELLYADHKWDVLHVPQLRPGSKLLEALARTPGAQRFTGEHCSRMPAVTMSELPVKIRRNAMYYRNRAARQGTLELVVADTNTQASSFDDLVRLHTDRWQRAGQAGIFSDERVIAWHREALPLLDEAGLLRIVSLRLNGEVLGVVYSLADPPDRADSRQRPARTQYFYITAYSPEHADLRPGTVLLALAIEQAAHEGVDTIDMLRGDEAYKRIWHLEPVATYGYTLPHPARTAAAA